MAYARDACVRKVKGASAHKSGASHSRERRALQGLAKHKPTDAPRFQKRVPANRPTGAQVFIRAHQGKTRRGRRR